MKPIDIKSAFRTYIMYGKASSKYSNTHYADYNLLSKKDREVTKERALRSRKQQLKGRPATYVARELMKINRRYNKVTK